MKAAAKPAPSPLPRHFPAVIREAKYNPTLGLVTYKAQSNSPEGWEGTQCSVHWTVRDDDVAHRIGAVVTVSIDPDPPEIVEIYPQN